jgi:Tfp pilus assembly protein PilF
MTETEIIGAARAEVADYEKGTPAALRTVQEGLRLYPTSVRLWILRGDLIQLSDDDGAYSLDDALASYRAALEHDPNSAEANESIGRFLDAVQDKPAEAESYLRKAIELGGGQSAEEGLAQVLAQLGRPEASGGGAG